MFPFPAAANNITLYRVTHKGWDCEDDWKLFRFNDSKVKISLLLPVYIKFMAKLINDLEKKKTHLQFQWIKNMMWQTVLILYSRLWSLILWGSPCTILFLQKYWNTNFTTTDIVNFESIKNIGLFY